ncbi:MULTISPECIES: hypothetical protein [unclassified Flavobacterium]|uniref:hypothetical protein n=1 Tax=unclassified Flavobacterium TaxID=196869 RepID=UPI001F12EE69|nr:MULTISPECIES: hypothetical protein [unclassified Flavobacterium]UMY65295.1 hypothetical protein MKO97_12395 [Flavobacterium sp. HJ-32-4]UMY65313.1 hypothetical protein MKO97_12485 [Flavobacterium sp. HJ-32-4]
MNTKETIELFLTIWGAGLSTLLAVFTILKYKKDEQVKLSVIGTSDEPFDHIRISICNISTKPATIIAYSIGIGSMNDYQTIIVRKNLGIEKKLSESDIWTATISREEIITLFDSANVEHQYFQTLWSNVILSNGKVFSSSVYINPSIILEDRYTKAEPFIATDIFLNRQSLESLYFKIGLK